MKVMKVLFKNEKMAGNVVLATFSAIIFLAIAVFIDSKNHILISHLRYWLIFFGYLIICVAIADGTEYTRTQNRLLKINIGLAITILIGWAMHFSKLLPAPIQSVCGWSAFISFMLLITLIAIYRIKIGFND